MCSTLFTACAGANHIKERRNPHSYRREQKAEAHMKMEQKRLDRENYKQRKKMERLSNKQNHSGWGGNSLGNVFGL